MKKLFLIFLVFLMVGGSRAQLVAVSQLPPGGLLYKPQLWNMVLTNTTNAPLYLHIEVMVRTTTTAQDVLSGVSRPVLVKPGTTLVNASVVAPVQYNVLSSAYTIDASPNGMLPIGAFTACYTFFKHDGDLVQEIGNRCQDISVQPLAPPQLQYPYDGGSVQEGHPVLQWLPPVPAGLFSNLRYDLQLTEVLPGQSAADALQQNVPLYHTTNLSELTHLYPASAPALQYDKWYAWGVVAKNNGTELGASPVWQFTLKQYQSFKGDAVGEVPYARLRKAPETSYAIFAGTVKFHYYNEAADSLWQIKVYDLSTPERASYLPLMDTVALRAGENLVQLDVRRESFFTDKHTYLLEVYNSRNEAWRLRFEYRRPNEQ